MPVPEPDRLGGVGLGDEPLDGDRGVDYDGLLASLHALITSTDDQSSRGAVLERFLSMISAALLCRSVSLTARAVLVGCERSAGVEGLTLLLYPSINCPCASPLF